MKLDHKISLLAAGTVGCLAAALYCFEKQIRLTVKREAVRDVWDHAAEDVTRDGAATISE